jgi:hypothetical protein
MSALRSDIGLAARVAAQAVMRIGVWSNIKPPDLSAAKDNHEAWQIIYDKLKEIADDREISQEAHKQYVDLVKAAERCR